MQSMRQAILVKFHETNKIYIYVFPMLKAGAMLNAETRKIFPVKSATRPRFPFSLLPFNTGLSVQSEKLRTLQV